MNAFRLGKLGIEIRIDASWLFIFALLTWNLSSVFAGWHPDWSSYEAIGVAVSAAILFFGCIVLHELAHALVAERYGLRVRNITLFLFGGVSNIEHERLRRARSSSRPSWAPSRASCSASGSSRSRPP